MGSLLVDERVDYYPEGIFGVVFRNLGVWLVARAGKRDREACNIPPQGCRSLTG
jgi:hypothetical protein